MIQASFIFLGLAIFLGAVLLFNYYRKKINPFPLSIAHGALAALGVICLVIPFSARNVSGAGYFSLVLFMLAGILGGILFIFHLKRERFPSFIMIFHVLGALSGLSLLLYYYYSS